MKDINKNIDLSHLTEDEFDQKLTEAIVIKERAHLKSFIQGLEKKSIPAKTRKLSLWQYTSIAAAFAVLFLVFSIINGPSASDKIYTAYYDAYPNTYKPIMRGEVSDLDKEMYALTFYENEQYVEAYKLFKSFKSDSDYINLYKGISALETGEIEESKSIFQDLVQTSTKIKATSQWYLAMCHLKLGENQEAKTALESISNKEDGAEFYSRAVEILKILT